MPIFDFAESDRPDMTPMLDMMFILLVFFMVSATFLYPVMHVQLPKAGSSEAVTRADAVVAILANGQIQIDGKAIRLDSLSDMARSWRPDAVVIVRGDKQAAFERFVGIMDVLQQAKIQSILIEHE